MTCELTGLTDAEKSAITESWKFLSINKKENGMTLFMTLFSNYPETLKYFQDFEGKSIDELKAMPDMRAHAAAVMYAMGSLIDNLYDPEVMVGLVRKIARNHKGRSIGKPDFEKMRALYGKYLDDNLGNKTSSEVRAAWDRFLLSMNNQIEADQA